MSFIPFVQIPTRCITDRMRITSEHGVLVCPNCGEHTWFEETNQTLRCESCKSGLPIRNRIVDCFQMLDSEGSTTSDWEDFYRASTKPYSAKEDWWCLSSWKRHLFGVHLGDLSGKLIVDFGCGTAVRVAALAPITVHSYRYVGIDSSMAALTHAARVIPGGLFVHGTLDSLRLWAESGDFVLCLGVLMYAQDLVNSLCQLLHVLKPGGILLVHEQIRRTSWRKVLQRFVPLGRQPYPSAFGVELRALEKLLERRGTILHRHLGGSPLRKLFMRLLDGTVLEPLRPSASWLDSVWCITAGRLFRAIGASEVQIVFQKT
jgi:SAM-dependent methyltransferase